MISWQDIFKNDAFGWKDATTPTKNIEIRDLETLKRFLDAVHIRFALVKPFQENEKYPLVESRELLPSFDSDMFEFKNLPGFSMVAFARHLDYFTEVFQYDKLHLNEKGDVLNLQDKSIWLQNIQAFAARLPRYLQQEFRAKFQNTNIVNLKNYALIFNYLLQMDRAQVLAWDEMGVFYLTGVFASFPSDIDNELKRFGLRIGKFLPGDNEIYEQNRNFVYQFLMELYGFPIVSERRTSSALFARRLHKMGEHFLLRVLGQTDRTITTYYSLGGPQRYPFLEKTALVRLEKDQKDVYATLADKGFLLDPERRVIILRVRYRQHAFNSSNIREDRAISIAEQDIIHPLTGEVLSGLNVIKDTSNMLLHLNDIVRGEYTGSVLYKRTEIVQNTDTDEKKLKFLYTWLTKHQRRIISYSEEFFNNVNKIVSNYLFQPDKDEIFSGIRELYLEVCSRFSYIQQAHSVRILQDISVRKLHKQKLTYREMFKEALELLNDLKFEVCNYFPPIVDDIINTIEKMLSDNYIRRKYILPPESTLSKIGLEIRKSYGRLVQLQDTFKKERKNRIAKTALNKS
ncbi:MAG: hypothetical protein IJU40_00465 [Desulfovibrionaceae bacterium]|nr:hypothetical protein [Desulfovibrionaceae bacterium]